MITTPAKATPDEAGSSRGKKKDSTSDSSEGPPPLRTPIPTSASKIDWGQIELPSTEELTKMVPAGLLEQTPPVFRLPESPMTKPSPIPMSPILGIGEEEQKTKKHEREEAGASGSSERPDRKKKKSTEGSARK